MINNSYKCRDDEKRSGMVKCIYTFKDMNQESFHFSRFLLLLYFSCMKSLNRQVYFLLRLLEMLFLILFYEVIFNCVCSRLVQVNLYGMCILPWSTMNGLSTRSFLWLNQGSYHLNMCILMRIFRIMATLKIVL